MDYKVLRERNVLIFSYKVHVQFTGDDKVLLESFISVIASFLFTRVNYRLLGLFKFLI